MKLINGQFYDEQDNPIPLEIGNIEQISKLKELGAIKPINENVDESKEPIPVEASLEQVNVFYNGYLEFTCICGNYLQELSSNTYEEQYFEDESDVIDDFGGTEVVCKNCRRVYLIEGDQAILQEN